MTLQWLARWRQTGIKLTLKLESVFHTLRGCRTWGACHRMVDSFG